MSARGGPPREGFSGMRLPPLIKQLRRILDQYPDDGQILKELIQNAEDGDATVVKILYNGRTSDIHPSLSTGSVLQDIPHLRALQAPGLCVYNDGIFTEDDWDGIRMVQSSVKEQELHKVGRFGLGFKSVFHLTDVPMIISGEHILLIDPHQFEDNHDMVCFMKNLNNIDEFKQALLSVIGGTFGFTEKTIQEGKFEGTLFWFPLRREESELSDNVYGDEKMQDLFQAFREEAPHMLLFLKSLTEIQLLQQHADLFSKHDEEAEVDKEGNLDMLFSVNVSSGNTEDVTRIRQEFANSIRELKGKLPPQAIERRYHLTVNTVDSISSESPTKETRTWIVVQHHAGGGNMSKPFRKLCFDKEISSYPCVGLAVALEDHQTGHIFCFLPLPLETKSPTGLPVHVHGHFALSQNRRHLKWPTADQKKNRAQTDKAIRWNQHLLLDVFPQAYTSLVKELISHWEASGRSESLFQRIYRTLPVVSEVTEQWQGLTKAFFQLLVKETFLYTPSSGGRLVGLTGAQLLDVSSSSDINDTLVQTSVLCKNTIVPLPRHVCDAIKQYTPKTETLRFVNPEAVCDMLRSNNVYSHLTGQQKLNLLEYICTSEDTSCLEGVTLLPLANGSFDNFEHDGSVYFCKSEDVAMFPGLENRFVMTGGPTEKYLQKLAEAEIFGIRKLTPESFVTLFKICMETAFPEGDAVLAEDSDFTLEWLTRVWGYITDQEIDVKTELPDIPLIPGDTLCEPSAELHPVSSTFVCMNIDTVGHIDEAMGAGLRHLGVVTLQSVPSVLVKNTSILGDVIKYPSVDGVMKALEETEQRETSVECAAKFNQRAEPDEKISLVKFLASCKNINEGVKQLLRKLQIFPTTESSNNDLNVSLDDFSLLEPKEHFDVCYPSVYIRGISGESLALAERLGAKHVTQHDVILGILKLMKSGDKRYTKTDVETFMIFLLENTEFFTSDKILKQARDIKFLTTTEDENVFYQAKELFEPHPDLNALFEGKDRIPCERFLGIKLKQGLQTLGLKTVNEVTENDLCEIGNLTETCMDNERARRKGQALVEYLNRHIKRLKIKSMSQLRYTKFIPCKTQKPENYPDSLKLFGEDSCGLVSMQKDNSQNVWSSKYMNVVGAIAPIAKNLSDAVMKAFNLATEPPLEKVLDHLEIVLECYDPAPGDQDYSAATSDVYKYLAQVKHNNMSNSCRERLSTMKFIWINAEYGFQGITDIWTKKSKSDIDVMPYRFCLPKVLIHVEKIVLNLGSVQTQTTQMLVDVLKEIQEKHKQAQHQKINLSDDIQKDLRITMHIINTLKTRTPRPNDILLPIHDESESMFLTLKPIKECTYCNSDMSLDIDIDGGSVEDQLYFVHRDISEDTAFKLEVPLLADRILEGAEEIDFKFGQKESLTKRLHNILKGYSSLSVPKEIIQNAEDAHATKVMFLYDERQNQQFKTSLIDPKMASLQGPALWAYNDSKFTDRDFKNIQDLGGATKEDDESKLGRFGLGFNSVYNFTDVPSFISGNTAVFLDPHETYLGKRRLGLKVDLSSMRGRRMLQTMKGQFLPFDGIFGCQLGAGRTEEICGGTLFRLPLRTEEQASESKIKNQSFTRSDMQSYLRDIAKTAGNLLQFTQNIKCVEIYHLTNGSPVDQCKLLLSVVKRTEEQCVVREGTAEPIQPHVNMLSFFADKWKESNGTCDDDYTIEKVDMCLENTKQFQSLFGVKQCNERIRWQITWTMGGNDSKQFAKLASVKGLIPLASTAIALTTSGEKNDVITVCDLSKCPSGFYDAGHLYCFLPLPLPPTSFAMHISAPFALTDDRQHLCALSEDNRNSVPGKWNQVLQQDVLSTAIVTTLDGLKEAQLADSTAYYKLWPRVNLSGDDTEQQLITIDVARNFYAVICRGKHQIFLEECSGNYAAFSDARFLSADLAYHETVGKSALRIFETFWKSDIVIDLPEEIFESFANASGDLFRTRVLDTKDFFEQVFFPNIMDDSMEFHDREVLTHFALSLLDPDIDNLLQQSSCIPSKPMGSMKIPGQLVHPKGKAASMFSDADEVFPSDTFSDNLALDRLCSLGMIKDDLPWDMIISRLETVEMIHAEDTVAANRRCLRILQYLNQSNPKYPRKKKFHECSEEIRNQFISTKFLPILQKPADWPFEWNGKDTETLSTPKSMFLIDAKDLVGCSHMVLDSYKLEGLYTEKDVLKWLGVLGKNDIPIEIVQDQLLSISRQISQGVLVNRDCTHIINHVYSNLDDFCRKHRREEPDLLQVLQNNPVILHDKKLIYPKQAAFNLKFKLEPHLFQIAPTLANSYKELFIALGVQDTFTVVRLQEEVDILSSKHGDACMSNKEVELYVHMVTLLADTTCAHTNDNSLPKILLPDDNKCLYIAHDLCINDCNWIDKNSKMKYVHPTVSHQVAMTCGVKTKIHAKIETIAKPLSVADFGQTEKLTDRLKGILGGYPRDASIMKELLQNADDAGATELRFIKDFRSHPTERVFGDKWKLLQGPALCVWNNSSFTEQDLAGIQALGVGSKSDDPLKTGQYGVGFNAVYHLTDVPSFLTRGPNTPETLCVLDPNITYVPWATAKSPGCQFTDLMEVQDSFKDVYGCYLSDAADLNETGTMFRLPLRTKAMAEISEISKEEVPINGYRGMNALLEEFQQEAADALLFLHNVRSISIQSVSPNGDIVTEFSVVAKMSESDEKKLKEYKSGLPKHANTATDTEAFETTILIETTNSKGKDLKWLVVHRYGFDDLDSVPGILKECMEDGRIGMLPRGGVAVPLQRQVDQFKGKVFCMLPLRIETGLPMHINGHFALDHEARGNLWHGPHQYRTLWNESIIQHVIVPAFTTALRASRPDDNELTYDKALTLLHRYSKQFPVINDCNDDYWKLLSKSFYKGILLNSISIFPVVVPSAGLFPRVPGIQKSSLPVTIEWMPLTSPHEAPVYFNNIHTAKPTEMEEKDNLVEILKDCGMHIVDMPLDIVKQFVDSGLQDQVACTSPTMVLRFLKSENNKCHAETLPCDVKETPMQDLSALILVTRYCKEDPSFSKELNGLPLLLKQDMTLSVFQNHSPIIVTDALELVKGSPERMLHGGILSLYFNIIDETEVLRRLEISTFGELLPYTMGHLHSDVPVLWEEKKSPSERWMKKAWKFLHDEIKRTSGGQHQDVSVIKVKLTPLGEWCLLPGRTQTKAGSELKLYSVNTADNIFNLAQFDTIYKRYIPAFSKLSIPQLDVSTLMEFGLSAVNEAFILTKTLVVSLDNPIAVLKSISHIFTTGVEITTDIGQTVLKYFCSHITTFKERKSLTTVKMLKSLVIFEDIAGKLRNTDARTVYGISDFDSIPVEGMETWSFKLGMTLLKCPDFVKEMLTFLGIQILSPVELYEKFILKEFANLPRPAQVAHIKFVKNILLKKCVLLSGPEQKLIYCLKNISFIVAPDGSSHMASEYFSRKETLFDKFLSNEHFPPRPFDDPEWEDFLQLCGLVAKVSQEKFLEFARQVEQEGSTSIAKETKAKSKLLISHLFQIRSDLFEGRFLQTIKDIKFVLPHESSGNEESIMVKEIHPQIQQGKLICYSGSTTHDHFNTVWSSSCMFHSHADPNYFKLKHNSRERSKIDSLLGIQREPDVDKVVDHIENICKSLAQKQPNSLKAGPLHDIILKVLESNYKFLLEKKSVEKSVMKRRLAEIKFIFLPEDGIFVRPTDIVLDMTKEEAVKGYIYRAPVHFGSFFELFKRLGASSNVSANHYATVLESMAYTTKDTKLEPNELKTVKNVTGLLFKSLKKDEQRDLSVRQLFLLDEKTKLAVSSELVVADNEILKRRMHSLKRRYFIGFHKLGISVTDMFTTFNLLAERYRPKVLTKMTSERLHNLSRHSAHVGQLAIKYKDHIANRMFLHGLIRLINDQRRLKTLKALENDELLNIEERLAGLVVKEVNKLSTILVLLDNDQEIENSTEERICFLDDANEPLTVYIHSTKTMKKVLHSWLALAINKLTGNHLTLCINQVESMLDLPVGEIKGFLDSFTIAETGYICGHFDNTVLPALGTDIDEEFHWMLDNGFYIFEEEEYVGFEKYDPLTEEEFERRQGSGDGTKPEYIYAKVKKIIDETATAIHARYLVDVGEAELKEVCGLDLYKFIRIKDTGKHTPSGTDQRALVLSTRTQADRNENQQYRHENQQETGASPIKEDVPLNMDTVLKEIREILKEAWKMPDKKQRDKVKKRLLFKWHPDKNKGNTEFCTKVFQRIQNYVEMLELGKNIDEETGSDTKSRSKSSRSGFDEWFYEEMNRRSKQHRHHYEHHREDDDGFDDFFGFRSSSSRRSARPEPRPQPEEAKRWIRQATDDLKIARNTLQTGTGHNWSCFQCYMVCEKAVKGLLYNRDSREADEYRTEGLRSVARKLGNGAIEKLAVDLLTIVRDKDHTQYPTKSDHRPPYDKFTQEQATDACRIAAALLEKALEVAGFDFI